MRVLNESSDVLAKHSRDLRAAGIFGEDGMVCSVVVGLET